MKSFAKILQKIERLAFDDCEFAEKDMCLRLQRGIFRLWDSVRVEQKV